jgi:hypothetical protein
MIKNKTKDLIMGHLYQCIQLMYHWLNNSHQYIISLWWISNNNNNNNSNSSHFIRQPNNHTIHILKWIIMIHKWWWLNNNSLDICNIHFNNSKSLEINFKVFLKNKLMVMNLITLIIKIFSLIANNRIKIKPILNEQYNESFSFLN